MIPAKIERVDIDIIARRLPEHYGYCHTNFRGPCTCPTFIAVSIFDRDELCRLAISALAAEEPTP